MKLKRFVAIVISLAMVLSIVPAFSLTVSAANGTYYAQLYGCSGGGDTNYIQIGGTAGGGTNGNETQAPMITGTTTSTGAGPLGSARAGAFSFTLPVNELENIGTATLNMNIQGWNNSQGSGQWSRLVAYETDNGTWTSSFNNTAGLPKAVNNDYSYNAGYWTERIPDGTNGIVTIDVTNAVKNALAANAALASPSDKIVVSLRVQIPVRGVQITCSASDETQRPYLSIKKNADVTVNYVNANGSIITTRSEKALVGEEFTIEHTNNDNYIVVDKTESEDGYIFELIESETVTVTESGSVVNAVVTPIYVIKSDNLFPDSEDGIDNWTLGAGATVGTVSGKGTIEKSTDNAHSGEYALKMKVDWESADGGGWLSDKALALYADVNPNSMYYFAGNVNFGTDYNKSHNGGTEMTIGTLATAKTPTSVQGLTNGQAALANGGITSFNGTDTSGGAGNGKQFGGKNGTWQQLEYVMKTDSDSKQIAALFYWLCDAGTTYFDDFMLYEVEIPATSKEITATYTAGGVTVKEESKTIDASVADSASFDEYYAVSNGDVYYAEAITLTDSASIEMIKIDRFTTKPTGTVFMMGDNAYRAVGESLVTNGNFITGDTLAWYSRIGATPTQVVANSVAYDAEMGNNVMTISAGGNSAPNSIGTAWTVETGKTYYMSFYVGGGKPGSGNYQYNRVSDARVLNANGNWDLSGNILFNFGEDMVANTWNHFEKVFTASTDTVFIESSWTENMKFANFELVPVELANDAMVATTIKFVDSSATSTEVATAVVINKLPGDVIDLTAYAPETITYNNNLYSKDSTNETSYTVGDSAATVTITYTTDAVTNFEAVTATVIEGNTPILPTTITGYTGSGAETPVAITWADHTGLDAGIHNITGTADGINATATATVTVLSETFALDDADSYNGSANVLYFPVDIADEFSLEFDLTINQIKDVSVQMGYNGNLFSAAALGISPNGGVLKVTGGRKDGSSGIGHELVNPVAAGETYRMFLTMNASAGTYSLTVTKADGSTIVVSEQGFRQTQSAINTMSLITNGGGATGDIHVSNVKIHSTSAEAALTEYTINVEGSVTDSYTEKAKSVDALEIPYYEGNIVKSRSVSGTTVTFTYEAQKDTLGTWAIRNNVTDQSWITEMKYLGSHNAFANVDEVVVNEGGQLYGGVAGSGSTDEYTVRGSKTQTLDALEQLNAGVRFFDLRLTRQSDGTFWTFHGPAFNDFRPIAATIAQFARENPGEVIILDFQNAYDALYGTTYDVITNDSTYYGPDPGDDNKYFYDALTQLLVETGLWEFMPDNWDQRYGALTNNGTKSVIIPVAKGRGANCISKFVNRNNATSDTTTYSSSSDYDTVVSKIESAIAAGQFGTGAKFGTIHAYTTPLLDLVDAAAETNLKWINEDLDTWMASGYGDVFMINGVTEEIGMLYLERLSEYNRDGFDDTYTNTVEGVTVEGASANVPFSTVLNVAKGDAEVPEGYLTATKYDISLTQFVDTASAAANVTLTFEKASADDTTVDVLLALDGTVLATAERGANVIYSAAAIPGSYILATQEAPADLATVKYMVNGEEVGSYETKVYEDGVVTVSAGIHAKQYYLDADVTATLVEENVYSVEVKPLTRFTWEKSSNSALTTNGTYDAARVVYWGSGSGNRTGYAYATVPAVSENQQLLMTIDVTFNNRFVNGQVPHAVFYTMNAETLKGVDLAGGSATTEALDALEATALTDFNMLTIISSSDIDRQVAADGIEYDHAVITVPVSSLPEGEIAVKMLDNGSQSGIAVINSLVFEVANKVTVDGTESLVKVGETFEYTLAEGGYALVDAAKNIYKAENGVVTIAAENVVGGMELTTKGLGLEMVTGAQVRIGDGVDANGKVEDRNSGLRFITMVNKDSTLATIEGATFGVMIEAEDSTHVEYIPATLWQTEGVVFTTALTNLAVGNYNRKFTATPYVEINGTKYFGEGVTRSIYQVAAGLLTKADADNTNYGEGALSAKSMIDVLNAYVNQTGIRLAIVDGNLAVHDQNSTSTKGGKYSYDAFFSVVSATNNDANVYSITIQPTGDNTEVKDYWKEYIRINNNNSAIKDYTSMVDNGDGTITITFDYASYLEDAATAE